MLVVDTPINLIKVKGRAREDLGDIESLAETIKDKGLIEPLVLNPDMRLIAGERRLRACELLGMEKVPTVIRKTSGDIDELEIELIENVFRKDMTWQERAKLEKRIFDAKISKDPEWSRRKQAELLEQSKSATARRIQLAEALDLLPDLGEAQTEDDAWKEYKKLQEVFVADEIRRRAPKEIIEASKWAEDHYRVGDALEGMAATGDGVADFAEVDPPFAVDLLRRKSRNQSREGHDRYNEIDPDEYVGFYKKAAQHVFRILKPHSFAVFWYGMTWHHDVISLLREVGFSVPDIPAIWYKGPGGQTASPDTMFGSCYEPFFLARKGQPKMARPGRSNVFSHGVLSPSKKIHATEKPIYLLEDILQTILLPGSVILCPFLGSGVTLRAAYKIGHTGWGYDLDERNKELFLRRVSEDMGAATAAGEVTDTEDEAAEE